jgi:hypothetical protein
MQFSDWLIEKSTLDARYGQLAAAANDDPDWPERAGYATTRRRLVARGAGDLLPELAQAWVDFYPVSIGGGVDERGHL